MDVWPIDYKGDRYYDPCCLGIGTVGCMRKFSAMNGHYLFFINCKREIGKAGEKEFFWKLPDTNVIRLIC